MIITPDLAMMAAIGSRNVTERKFVKAGASPGEILESIEEEKQLSLDNKTGRKRR